MADQSFESRKRDHIQIALDPQVQSTMSTGLERIDLIHEALPDVDFAEIRLDAEFAGQTLRSPIFISSMTAGHENAGRINGALARLAQRRGILMGVGSQRRELEDPETSNEWLAIRAASPNAVLVGNIGIAQAIKAPLDRIRALVDRLQAAGLFIHLNSLQECLQPEGTPQFRGGLRAIEQIARALSVPVIVKEVGCGFSVETLRRLQNIGVYAVDVSGLGGTHWGRVEGRRLPAEDMRADCAEVFGNWGISTVDSMLNAEKAQVNYQVWASGGVRNGLDVAKLVSMGASMVGLAQPWLQVAMESDAIVDERLDRLADKLDVELRTALFCTGCRTPAELRERRRWTWRKS